MSVEANDVILTVAKWYLVFHKYNLCQQHGALRSVLMSTDTELNLLPLNIRCHILNAKDIKMGVCAMLICVQKVIVCYILCELSLIGLLPPYNGERWICSAGFTGFVLAGQET